MEVGAVIAIIPVLIGVCAIERWRRATVRELERAERRASHRDEVWHAVEQLERAA
jgi:hypothetical protein